MITSDGCVLTPAYGRDYKSAKAAKEDFLAGKDFELNSVIHGFGLCSIRDFTPGIKVTIRYKKLTEMVIITV